MEILSFLFRKKTCENKKKIFEECQGKKCDRIKLDTWWAHPSLTCYIFFFHSKLTLYWICKCWLTRVCNVVGFDNFSFLHPSLDVTGMFIHFWMKNFLRNVVKIIIFELKFFVFFVKLSTSCTPVMFFNSSFFGSACFKTKFLAFRTEPS